MTAWKRTNTDNPEISNITEPENIVVCRDFASQR
jgi:hypothetical protein